MSPGKFLFLLFIVIPLLEIYLLIQVGSAIGALATVILTVFTAIAGASLVRLQAPGTLLRVQQSLSAGQLPAQAVFDGASLLVAGALLLTPGFFTDAVGFLLLLPGFRRKLLAGIIAHQPRRANPRTQTRESGPKVIDGEYTRED